jgi:hypothetical protein
MYKVSNIHVSLLIYPPPFRILFLPRGRDVDWRSQYLKTRSHFGPSGDLFTGEQPIVQVGMVDIGDESRRGSTWPRWHTPCWHVYTNKTRVMPLIPTKSVACMSTSWLLGSVYMAKSCKGKKRDPDPDRKHWPSLGWQPHPGKDSCLEIRRSNSGYFSWQKPLRKARAHVGLSSQWYWETNSCSLS